MAQQTGTFVIDFTAGDGSGVLQAGTLNPEGHDVYVTRALLEIIDPSTGASTLDIGFDAVATTLDDRIFDGLSGAVAGWFDNLIDHGTNGLAGLLWPAAHFLTIAEASGDVAGIVGKLHLQYVHTGA